MRSRDRQAGIKMEAGRELRGVDAEAQGTGKGGHRYRGTQAWGRETRGT